jgi:hypothetical protein
VLVLGLRGAAKRKKGGNAEHPMEEWKLLLVILIHTMEERETSNAQHSMEERKLLLVILLLIHTREEKGNAQLRRSSRAGAQHPMEEGREKE